MIFRKSKIEDLESMMTIIKQAQNFLKANKIDQWQNNYPNEQVLLKDIAEGESYVLEGEGKVLATTVISFQGESTYDEIYEGSWLSNQQYAVLHRVAVHEGYKGSGLGKKLIDHAEQMCKDKKIKSIKMDTHQDNKSMQRLLEKTGFTYCGIIYLQDGSMRLAYEKII